MKERGVDALQDTFDGSDSVAFKNVSVPCRSGQNQLEICGVRARLLIYGGVLEKSRGQLCGRSDPLGAGRENSAKPVADGMDRDSFERYLGSVSRRKRFLELRGFLDHIGEQHLTQR